MGHPKTSHILFQSSPLLNCRRQQHIFCIADVYSSSKCLTRALYPNPAHTLVILPIQPAGGIAAAQMREGDPPTTKLLLQLVAPPPTPTVLLLLGTRAATGERDRRQHNTPAPAPPPHPLHAIRNSLGLGLSPSDESAFDKQDFSRSGTPSSPSPPSLL
jgi:hypothetical protein